MQGCTRVSIPASVLAGDAEQLDAVAEFAGEGDVQRGDATDALDVDIAAKSTGRPNASAARMASL